MERTAILSLPLLAASQAQKHVTMNEALLDLDCLVNICVENAPQNDPPPAPSVGSRWLVGASPVGVWSGRAGCLAAWVDGSWRFFEPRDGWLVPSLASDWPFIFRSGTWHPLALPDEIQHVGRLGVGTTADASNPFAARLNNALITALGTGEGGDGDVRLKVNKESAADTASLLFQAAYAGAAEIGLIGNKDLEFKVSADGATWSTALRLNAASAIPDAPRNPKFKAVLAADQTITANAWTKVALSNEVFDVGANYDPAARKFTAPTAGIYHFGLAVGASAAEVLPSGIYVALYLNGVELQKTRRYGVPSPVNVAAVSTQDLLSLAAGDEVECWAFFVGAAGAVEASWTSFFGHKVI